jgi:hypothetical protein
VIRESVLSADISEKEVSELLSAFLVTDNHGRSWPLETNFIEQTPYGGSFSIFSFENSA